MHASLRILPALTVAVLLLLLGASAATAAPPPFVEQAVVVNTFKNTTGEVARARRRPFRGRAAG